ncbi:ORF089 [Saltwater crocodilepox virus]|nr:DNA-binding phosphoprotein [Saltwater crocodilepox virus]AVD69424.1 DNA-binding phosphoprotein [Saltwater crocodilepox virus]QGT46528.1 ORF089 [Saltwater crocodilepox virus]QGT46744.1 ORF089 [Saltwater crocodilepox virus]QGT46960.1 ORF089 [Saltwater crocodilepox virus]
MPTLIETIEALKSICESKTYAPCIKALRFADDKAYSSPSKPCTRVEVELKNDSISTSAILMDVFITVFKQKEKEEFFAKINRVLRASPLLLEFYSKVFTYIKAGGASPHLNRLPADGVQDVTFKEEFSFFINANRMIYSQFVVRGQRRSRRLLDHVRDGNAVRNCRAMIAVKPGMLYSSNGNFKVLFNLCTVTVDAVQRETYIGLDGSLVEEEAVSELAEHLVTGEKRDESEDIDLFNA